MPLFKAGTIVHYWGACAIFSWIDTIYFCDHPIVTGIWRPQLKRQVFYLSNWCTIRLLLKNVKIYIKNAPTCFGLKPSSGSYHSCFAKVVTLNNQLKYVVVESLRSCGCIFIQSYLVWVCVVHCAHCTVHYTHTHQIGLDKYAAWTELIPWRLILTDYSML